eukprot:scaffold712_cov404-Prasinococcus_capsulatus_cf.AAC.9
MTLLLRGSVFSTALLRDALCGVHANVVDLPRCPTNTPRRHVVTARHKGTRRMMEEEKASRKQKAKEHKQKMRARREGRADSREAKKVGLIRLSLLAISLGLTQD